MTFSTFSFLLLRLESSVSLVPPKGRGLLRIKNEGLWTGLDEGLHNNDGCDRCNTQGWHIPSNSFCRLAHALNGTFGD